MPIRYVSWRHAWISCGSADLMLTTQHHPAMDLVMAPARAVVAMVVAMVQVVTVASAAEVRVWVASYTYGRDAYQISRRFMAELITNEATVRGWGGATGTIADE